MLVIASDLHLNDGSAGSLLGAGAAELLIDRACELAWRASWRADGSYSPLERLDLVLLGDTLDITRSARWLQGQTRPWTDPQSPAAIETTGLIVDDILRKNVDIIRQLRSLATEGVVTVPHVGSNGQPLLGEEELLVPVRTHLLVGDHDWPLHLPGPGYDLIRHKVAHHLGLANQHNRPFPHEASESDELAELARRHRVLFRHGDIFDPLAFAENRDSASLGDVISVELICRFLQRIEKELAGDLSPQAIAALKQLDEVRPVLLVPSWMEGVLERFVPQIAHRNAVRRTWDNLVESLLELPITRQLTRRIGAEVLDGLAAALQFSRRDSHHWSTRTLAWLAALRGSANDSYASHAATEPDFRNRRARHIVYGHSHRGETVPLDASHADGFVLHQTYFNTGSWRSQHLPTYVAAGVQEYSTAGQFQLLSLYQADERSGRSYEVWTGSLAPAAAVITPPAAAAPSASAVRAPHFARAAAGRGASQRSF
jgi:UDP-2,3-diacylglucosamine pyrophosphatase LpxH